MTSIFRGEIPDLRGDRFVPNPGDRPIVVVQPFIDPPNSFRARTVSDMFFLSPGRERFSTLEFDVGLNPNINPIIISIQNRSLNTALRVNLTLPSYVRSNLGNEFLVPAIGDTITPPIVHFDRTSRVGPAIGEDEFSEFSEGFRRLQGFLGADAPDLVSFPTIPDLVSLPVFSGKGLINVTLTFSETQAKTFNPGVETGKIIFDMFPNEELTGPVFISTTVGKPADLNVAPELDFPIDDNEPIVTGSVEPPILVVTESIEVEKLVPTPTISFNPGADGVTDAGVKFTAGEGPIEGPPPSGWVTQADGRAYPPIIPELVCDPITGAAPDGTELEKIPKAELTELQKLLLSVKDRPPTFGSLNKRRGFVIEPKPFLRGNASNIDTVIRLTPQLIVADSIPGRADFKIIARGGQPVPLDKFTRQINDEIDVTIAAVKEGNLVGTVFAPGTLRRLFFESKALRDIIEKGTRFEIKNDQNTAAELVIARVVAPGASILFALKNEGAG